jgi:transmembrane sensor
MNGRLKYLYDLYLKNQASAREVEELMHLLNSEPQETLELLYREYNEQLEKDTVFFSRSTSEKMLTNIFSDDRRQVKNWKENLFSISFKKYSIAAILLITIGLGLLFVLTQNLTSGNESIAVSKDEKIQPGGSKAVLKLSDGSVIVLDNAKNGLLREQQNTLIKKTAQGQLVFQMKESIADQNPSSLNTIETPKGGQYQVILSDNTIAWLNAASSIEFPSTFSGKSRKVKIKGEVYFEVAKNADMPFIVETRNVQIEVLGTHFNVMDYEDEEVSRTTLLEGSVRIVNQEKTEILKPGQQALYGETMGLKLQTVADPMKEIAWKSGFFVFKDTSIDVVMREVSRWYDVKVIFSGAVPNNEFTGKISRNVDLNEFLKILSYAGFNFKIEGKNLIVIS